MESNSIEEFKRERFLKNNPLKKIILEKLTKKPITATDIAKDLRKHRSSVSKILIELSKKGYAKCINPKDTRDRGYIKIKDF